jgi:hypothetical protein
MAADLAAYKVLKDQVIKQSNTSNIMATYTWL